MQGIGPPALPLPESGQGHHHALGSSSLLPRVHRSGEPVARSPCSFPCHLTCQWPKLHSTPLHCTALLSRFQLQVAIVPSIRATRFQLSIRLLSPSKSKANEYWFLPCLAWLSFPPAFCEETADGGRRRSRRRGPPFHSPCCAACLDDSQWTANFYQVFLSKKKIPGGLQEQNGPKITS